MSDDLGTIRGAIEIDLSGLARAVGEARSSLAGMERAFESTGRVAGGAGQAIGGFFRDAAAFAVGGVLQQAFNGVAAAVGNLKQGLIGGNAEFERYQTQFGVLLGSTDAAKQRLQELATFGATTPFELPEVVRADKILQSFGLHAGDAAKRFGFAGADIRTIAGDVASGTGAGFEEISTYLGKFSSGATGEAIARFQELGIVTKAQLTEMGLHFDKGGSLIIKSQADLDRATGILLKGMQDKYGGMMAAQSGTFEGMLSNLSDWKNQTLRTLGAPIFEVLKPGLQRLLAWLPTIQPAIDAFAQKLAAGIGGAMAWLTDTAIPGMQRAWATVSPYIDTARLAFAGLADVLLGRSQDFTSVGDWLQQWTLQLTGFNIQPLLDGFGNLATLAQPVVNALTATVGALLSGGPASAGFLGSLAPLALKLNEFKTALISTAIEGLGKLLGGLKDNAGFTSFLSGLGLSQGAITTITSVLGSFGGILQQAGEWVKSFGAWLQNDLLPPVINAGQGFLTMLQPHIQWLADFANTTLMPALTAVGKFIGDNLPGAIKVVAPLLTSLVDAGLSVVELALKAIATTWTTYLQPAFDGIGKWLKDTTGGWDNLARGAQAVADSFAKIGQFARDLAEGKIKMPDLPHLPGFASGVENFRGGLALVGERGPELVTLPRGSGVIPSAQTARILAAQGATMRQVQALAPGAGAAPALPSARGGGAITLTVPITITGAIIDNEARLRGLGEQIGAAVRRAVHDDLSKAVDAHILSGGPA